MKSTPNSLASISGEIGELVHVHGYTDKDLIMGVNDASEIENETFSQDETVLNELVKPRQNEIIKMNYDYRATQIINRSRIICVYGMSIGETDQKWWKLIMQWLQRDINNHLIVLRHRHQYEWFLFGDVLLSRLAIFFICMERFPPNIKKSLLIRYILMLTIIFLPWI